MSSTRLPGKVLMKVNGNSLLNIHVKRVSKSKLVKKHIIAISNNPSDDILEKYCIENNLNYFRGSEENVLDRFYQIVNKENPDIVVRLTADCPLIDSVIIDKCISLFLSDNVDYLSNTLSLSFPDGLDVEVIAANALKKTWSCAELKSDLEHVTPYIYKNSNFKGGKIFKAINFENENDTSNYRITVDEFDDFLLIEKLIINLGEDKRWQDYINYIECNKLFRNLKYKRNEGYDNSLKND